jgi:hypothetical protein
MLVTFTTNDYGDIIMPLPTRRRRMSRRSVCPIGRCL